LLNPALNFPRLGRLGFRGGAAFASPRIVIITPSAGNGPDTLSHMVLNVPDIDGAVGRVLANGGAVERLAAKSATSSNVIAMVKDPAGNRGELSKEP
jgi:predicted enzyme related to lactoylglutathione lyase